MKKLLFLAFTICLTFSTFSQDSAPLATDYIVLSDTLQKTGVSDYNEKTGILKFKLKFSSLYKEYSINDVSEFKYQNALYFRKTVDGTTLYAKRLASGEVSLYETPDYYILENAEGLVVVDEANYKTVFDQQYRDYCNWDYNKAKLKYKRAIMVILVENYNEDDCYRLPTNDFSVHIGGGQVVNKIKSAANPSLIKSFEEESFQPQLGVEKEFSISTKSSFVMDLTLISHKFTSGTIRVNQAQFEFEKKTFYLSLNPMMKFYFGDFFVSPGIGSAFAIVDDSKFEPVDEEANLTPGLDNKGLLLGYHIGLGYRFINSESLTLSVQLRHMAYGNKTTGLKTSNIGVLMRL